MSLVMEEHVISTLLSPWKSPIRPTTPKRQNGRIRPRIHSATKENIMASVELAVPPKRMIDPTVELVVELLCCQVCLSTYWKENLELEAQVKTLSSPIQGRNGRHESIQHDMTDDVMDGLRAEADGDVIGFVNDENNESNYHRVVGSSENMTDISLIQKDLIFDSQVAEHLLSRYCAADESSNVDSPHQRALRMELSVNENDFETDDYLLSSPEHVAREQMYSSHLYDQFIDDDPLSSQLPGENLIVGTEDVGSNDVDIDILSSTIKKMVDGLQERNELLQDENAWLQSKLHSQNSSNGRLKYSDSLGFNVHDGDALNQFDSEDIEKDLLRSQIHELQLQHDDQCLLTNQFCSSVALLEAALAKSLGTVSILQRRLNAIQTDVAVINEDSKGHSCCAANGLGTQLEYLEEERQRYHVIGIMASSICHLEAAVKTLNQRSVDLETSLSAANSRCERLRQELATRTGTVLSVDSTENICKYLQKEIETKDNFILSLLHTLQVSLPAIQQLSSLLKSSELGLEHQNNIICNLHHRLSSKQNLILSFSSATQESMAAICRLYPLCGVGQESFPRQEQLQILLLNTVQESMSSIRRLKELLDSYVQANADLHSELLVKQQEVIDQGGGLNLKTAELLIANDSIVRLKSELVDCDAQHVLELQSQETKFLSEIAARDEEIKNLKGLLAESATEIAGLQTNLKSLPQNPEFARLVSNSTLSDTAIESQRSGFSRMSDNSCTTDDFEGSICIRKAPSPGNHAPGTTLRNRLGHSRVRYDAIHDATVLDDHSGRSMSIGRSASSSPSIGLLAGDVAPSVGLNTIRHQGQLRSALSHGAALVQRNDYGKDIGTPKFGAQKTISNDKKSPGKDVGVKYEAPNPSGLAREGSNVSIRRFALVHILVGLVIACSVMYYIVACNVHLRL